MTDVPRLMRREVVEELDRLYRGRRDHHLLALYGQGDAESVRGERAGDFEIVPVRSELELRERMPPLEDTSAKIAFLVPWQGDVPLDLAGRFMDNGRVLRIDPASRIASLCGASQSDDLRNLALVRYLLRPSNPRKSYPIAAGLVTAGALWDAWLAGDWGVDVSGGLGRDTLLVWAATDGRGGQFREAMTNPDAAGVRDELFRHLLEQLGAVGPVIWQAWEVGKGRDLVEFAVLCETLASNDDALVRFWLTDRLKVVLGAMPVPELVALATDLGEAAPLALRLMERRGMGREIDEIVRGADARIDSEGVRPAVITNDRLPSAWERRLEKVAAALEHCVASPSADAVRGAQTALKALESHTLFQETAHTRAVKRADMAARLLAWLVARPDNALVGSGNDYADVEVLGRWYAEQGGFVDFARRWARGSAEGPIGHAAQAVVEWADRERAVLDARFARALERWVESGRPSKRVVPIDEAIKRIAVAFLTENKQERRLLVLLMDGMAWAQAVELLQSLGSRPHGCAPLSWHAMNRIGDGAYPVVLANLPTLTEVSRAAFFAGKEMPKGSTLNTQDDVEWFRENKQLHPFCDETVGPRLLLRGEGHTGDGSASQEALTLIADPRRGVVGIVINAIDASLKGDTQQHSDWTVESIRSLSDILTAARDAGRTILLASDHGHVPADRLRTLSSPAQAGARYRPWRGDADALQPGEHLFKGQGVYTRKGAEGVVLLCPDDLRYGGAAHAGEHGGASLAEVVAPCVLIGWDPPGPEAFADKALRPRPAYVPDWWHFDIRPQVEIPATPKPPPVAAKQRKANENQLGLPNIVPAGPATPTTQIPPTTSPLSGTLATFAECEMLKARAPSADLREMAVRAVALLLSRGPTLAADVFAQHSDVPNYRVEGYVRRVQEVLNVDGYAVIRFDPGARHVSLDKPKLEQLFEVKL